MRHEGGERCWVTDNADKANAKVSGNRHWEVSDDDQ